MCSELLGTTIRMKGVVRRVCICLAMRPGLEVHTKAFLLIQWLNHLYCVGETTTWCQARRVGMRPKFRPQALHILMVIRCRQPRLFLRLSFLPINHLGGAHHGVRRHGQRLAPTYRMGTFQALAAMYIKFRHVCVMRIHHKQMVFLISMQTTATVQQSLLPPTPPRPPFPPTSLPPPSPLLKSVSRGPLQQIMWELLDTEWNAAQVLPAPTLSKWQPQQELLTMTLVFQLPQPTDIESELKTPQAISRVIQRSSMPPHPLLEQESFIMLQQPGTIRIQARKRCHGGL